MMLIPFLQTLGIQSSTGRIDGINKIISKGFQTFGLPLNLLTILIIYVVLVASFAWIKAIQTVLNMKIEQGFVIHLQDQLYRSLTYSDWLFLVQKKSSDLTHALTSDFERIGTGTAHFLHFLGLTFLITFHIAVAFLLSWKLTLITLVFSGILFVFMRPLTQKAYETGRSFRVSEQKQYSTIVEHLIGMKTAKSYGSEEQFIQKFKSLNQKIAKSFIDFSRARAATYMYFEISAVVVLSVYLFIAIKFMHISVPSLVLLVLIFARVLPKFSTMLQTYQYIKNMFPAYSGKELLYEQSQKAQEFSLQTKKEPIKFQHSIFFKDVTFRYSNLSKRNALHNVSLEIPAKKITAVIGPSGSGKSTMADLLLGLLKPDSGIITVDDKSITGNRIQSWRHSVGYVPQETFLFHDTIRANVLWANPSATENDLWQAFEMAAADDFINELPKGLDTVIGDRGIKLSGGERQKIALARALLRRPQLLLLDEATSSLDSHNEHRILEAIESLHGKITIVLIAHRISTIHFADRIIVLGKGCVLESGTLEALSKDNNSKFNLLFKGKSLN